jgi:hypothetical protein
MYDSIVIKKVNYYGPDDDGTNQQIQGRKRVANGIVCIERTLKWPVSMWWKQNVGGWMFLCCAISIGLKISNKMKIK